MFFNDLVLSADESIINIVEINRDRLVLVIDSSYKGLLLVAA